MKTGWRSVLVLVVGALLLPPPPVAHATSLALLTAKRCRKGVTTIDVSYVRKRRDAIEKCLDRLITCELQLEMDGANPTSCRIHGTDYCTEWLGPQSDSKLSILIAKTDLKATAYCTDFAQMLSAAAGGLWYANDPVCGSSVDVPGLVACVRGRLEETMDGAVSQRIPRAGILLDNIGLGGGFPNLVRPPTVPVTVATAPESGVLVDPGTINVPVGSALRFTGDGSTLGCGGSSNNGKVTLTVGSGPSAQELVLKEPYGASEVAVFGPFVTAGSLPYTIDYKDGGCDDTVTGTVSIP